MKTTDRVNSEPLQSFHIEFRLSEEISITSMEAILISNDLPSQTFPAAMQDNTLTLSK
ncbi:MAG: hypothetical protein WBE34_06320 [Candidatus Nitrosopolaris sp.]